jgi:polar amino acid transport system substrate-binding protein
LLLVAVAALVASTTACASTDRLADAVAVTVATTSTVPAAPAPACPAGQGTVDVDTESYQPASATPDTSAASVVAIRKYGKLKVGISVDTLHFGARNPLTGVFEGFDVDMLKEVARAIFGVGSDADAYARLEIKAIPYSQRIPKLQAGEVDIVAHTMTINCPRWQLIAFSSEYFRAGQRVLVKVGSGFQSLDDLVAAGKKVCVPSGSTNLEELKKAYATLARTEETDISQCLVDLQRGTVDAVTGDDTVLVGLQAQDPNTAIVGPQVTQEPYGLGIAKERIDLVRFVNAVLQQMRTDGRWKASYERWVGTPAPAPPAARYGREQLQQGAG